MNIDGINTGYVLDHIKAGKGFELYHLLGLDKADCTVAIIQRASSEKYGVILPGHEYEIAYGGWAPDFQDPVTYLELFRKDSPNNYSVYSNNEFEKLLADAANAKDAAKRMKKLAQAENQLLKTGGTIPLQFRKQAYMLNSKVKGIDFQLGAVSFNWAFAKKK